MTNLKFAGTAVLLALAPLLMTTSADARDARPGGRAAAAANVAVHSGSAAVATRSVSSNFAAPNFAAPSGGNVRTVVPQASGGNMAFNHGGGGRHWDGRRWIGPGIGFAAGLAAGAALASPGYYGDGYYANGTAPGYYGDSYAYDNGPDVTYSNDPDVTYSDDAAAGGDSVAYCQQTYRSYDPASGTYLGYDGLQHPCP